MKRIRKGLLVLAVVMMAVTISVTAVAAGHKTVEGNVDEVQKYGNLTMDINPSEFYDAGFELGDMLKVTVGDKGIEMPFVTDYSDVDTNNLLVRHDKDADIIVVAINMGDFAKEYDVEAGDKLTFTMKEKEGYLSGYLLHQLDRTNKRSDYTLDSVYANFRSIATTGINPGVVYRGSSPINNELNRAKYADELSEAVGIETVINLSDSKEKAEEYMAEQGKTADYYRSLYEDDKVITLDMGVDVTGEHFGKKLAEGLRFMIENEGPYLLHCTEGKDRAGFTAALLEALMGASVDEIKDDYMKSFENYYKIEEGSEKYKAIVESNIMISLTTVLANRDKGADISDVDLQTAAESYLLDIGLDWKEITRLKARLAAQPYYEEPNTTATVEEIEQYGHASTDLLIEDFYDMGFEHGDMVTAIFDNGFVVEAPFLDGYYVDKGDPLIRAYPDHEKIAVAINYGEINKVAEVSKGNEVTLMMSEPDEYKSQYEIRKLERTNKREDYDSDKEFANFRNLDIGKIAEGVVYRSSSPINNDLGRAAYADDLIEEAGVKSVVNMADSKEEAEEYINSEDFDSPYYANLYDNGNVLTLDMKIAFETEEFRKNIIKGLEYMIDNEAPYLIHCNEGKDRAGFMGVLLGALMDAEKEVIVEDYMQSYVNYYGVEKGTEKYEIIAKDVTEMLKVMTGGEDPGNADLSEAAENYLMNGGMTKEQINSLKNKLTTGSMEKAS
ncbi:MAG: tyrosine-protein phosphatase [Bacillota bacterium]